MPASPEFRDQDYRDILALRDRLRRFQHWSETTVRRAGLTPSQHQLLLAIRGHKGGLPTIGHVAGHLQVRHHSAVGLIDRAESAGLVERVPGTGDRRVVHVRLQQKGRAALDELTVFHVAELRALAESFASFNVPGLHDESSATSSSGVSHPDE